MRMSLRVLIDKRSPPIVDLNVFARLLFKTQRQQEIACLILEYVSKKKEAYLMRDVVPYINDKLNSVSPNTLSAVWLKLIRGGLLTRRFRYDPVKLDDKFIEVMQNLINYWNSYLQFCKHEQKAENR